jgi:hypothetical protein
VEHCARRIQPSLASRACACAFVPPKTRKTKDVDKETEVPCWRRYGVSRCERRAGRLSLTVYAISVVVRGTVLYII